MVRQLALSSLVLTMFLTFIGIEVAVAFDEDMLFEATAGWLFQSSNVT